VAFSRLAPCQKAKAFTMMMSAVPIMASPVPSANLFHESAVPTLMPFGRADLTVVIFAASSSPVKFPR
jgi:hypothetical protein